MTLLLPLLLLGALSGNAEAQPPTPTTQPAPPPTSAPTPAPRPRPAQTPTTATGTLTINITDGGGLPVQGVSARASGPVEREGTSLAGGIVRFLNMRGGDYRIRLAHPKFVLLERDVVMRPGASQTVDVTLSPAPEAPEPAKTSAPAPPPTPAVTAPPGEPRTVAVVDFVERNFISGRNGVKEDPLGCTASAKTNLVQVRDPQPERALADADEVIYVVAGEGTLRLGNRDVALSATTLSVIPRGTVRGITRKGRNPLIFVSVLSGPPCTR
jgi:mannose-6-phosphate isomerase-like protein (cupin superfamily)